MRETLKEQGLPAGGTVTFVQARTAHEIAKAHLARLRLQRMKGELVDRARATALVFRLAREEAGFLAQLAGAGRRTDRGRARRWKRTPCRKPSRRMCGASLPNCADVRPEFRWPATTAGSNWIGYVIHHAPGPMLAVQPTVELAKRFSRQRIDPLIAESAVLRERVKPARSRDAGNTVLSKEFPAGLLVITGANSAVGLRSMPARYLFLDEVDAYPPSADEEGDPVALAEARTRTFSWRAKTFLASTPTIAGLSRIEGEYEASDQRRYLRAVPALPGDAVAHVRAAALGQGAA